MAATPSVMIPLGSVAPDFTLPDTVSGKQMTLSEIKGSLATVVMFICNHCPYVKHVNAQLISIAKDYQSRGVNFIAISSNDEIQHPEDGPIQMRATAKELGYPFPYLFDETQDVARAYDAACTPDLFVYDKALKLVYRGQLDNSRPNSGIPVTGKDLRVALTALISGKTVSEDQVASVGCNIKWKK